MEPVFHEVSRCTIVETPLIVGGSQASHAEFPHMAVIGFGRNDTDVSWQCGGTIISDAYILTAAHCLESIDKGPATKVRVGMSNFENPEHTMQERNIVERIEHPEHRLPAKYHDIALLKLDVPLTLNPYVRPACLEVDHLPEGKTAIASGFGKTSYQSTSISENLMKVQLNYISKEDCEKAYYYRGRYLPDGLISSLLCAGVLEGGKDTCQGDSGGPLQRVLEDPYCTYSVVGVTSFGKFCGLKNSPAIYTRVSSYLDWIENTVWS